MLLIYLLLVVPLPGYSYLGITPVSSNFSYTGPSGTITLDPYQTRYHGSIYWSGTMSYVAWTVDEILTPRYVSHYAHYMGIGWSDSLSEPNVHAMGWTETYPGTFSAAVGQDFTVGPGTYYTSFYLQASINPTASAYATQMMTVLPGFGYPEPSGLLALGSGLAGLGGVFFRRRRR